MAGWINTTDDGGLQGVISKVLSNLRMSSTRFPEHCELGLKGAVNKVIWEDSTPQYYKISTPYKD